MATHWLPKIIKEFQKDYPNIQYEILLGDYREIENWIAEGRVDFGFLRLQTRDDYAIMSMVEQGLGISILPKLILRRIPYDVVIKPLDKPAYRTIGIAMKSKKGTSAALKKFLEYIEYRNN